MGLKLSRAIFLKDTWHLLSPCDVLMVCGDADRSYIYQGKRYAQLIDSLADMLRQHNLTVQTVAGSFSGLVREKAYGKPVTMNRKLLQSALGSRLTSLVKGGCAGKRWREKRARIFWKEILIKSETKAVIGIQPEVGLCLAGHELDVPVYDLQHGLISDTKDNPYYWSKNLSKKDKTELPHAFLCWDKPSAGTLRACLGKKDCKIRIIGNPWFVKFNCPEFHDSLYNAEKKRFSELLQKLPIILVTLQYNMVEYGTDYVSNNVMADCLEEAICRTNKQYCWYLRLHPNQLIRSDGNQTQRYLKDKFGGYQNVKWQKCSEAALPFLLSFVDLHITHFSATTIEAAWMGVRTGLLDPHIHADGKHSSFFEHERSTGFAQTLPLDADVIIDFIRKSLDGGKLNTNGNIQKEELVSFIDEIKQETICR